MARTPILEFGNWRWREGALRPQSLLVQNVQAPYAVMQLRSGHRWLGLVTAVAVAAALACPVECLEVATGSATRAGAEHAHSSVDESHGHHGDSDSESAGHDHSAGVECCQTLVAYVAASVSDLQAPVATAVDIARDSLVPTSVRAIALGVWRIAAGPAPSGRRYLVLRSLLI